MEPIKKAYGYVTRIMAGKTQVLVFQHPIAKAGMQIPKGTVNPNERPSESAIREIEEETGLKGVELEKLIAQDYWENDDGAIHNRYFYRMKILKAPDEWIHYPTGGGEEAGLSFRFFWIKSADDIELIRGHADYLNRIF